MLIPSVPRTWTTFPHSPTVASDNNLKLSLRPNEDPNQIALAKTDPLIL
jgi:hypothetical protein